MGIYDLIIRNGTVVTPTNSYRADLGVRNEKISCIAEPETLAGAKRVVDAGELLVLPGLIDPHVHIAAPFGGNIDVLDFYTASRAAALGGVTTFIDFSNTVHGKSVLEALRERREEMEQSAIDFGIHAKFVESSESLLKEIPQIIDYGCPTFKMFMTYRKAGVMIEDADLLKILRTAAANGGLCGFHAESNAIAEVNEEAFEREGMLGWNFFPECKPNACEAEAVERILHYAAYVGAPIYLFHVSAAESVAAIRRAKERGVKVTAETCTHYLTLTKEKNQGADGILYIMSPPLRAKADQEALWRALGDGTLSIVSSDNCSFTRALKEIALDRDDKGAVIPDFRKVVNGVCGLEERFGLLMAAGVQKEKITLNKLVEIASYNPARVFGMYPQKGTVAVGSDADLVLINPEKSMRLTAENLHYGLDYSIYDGYKPKGLPVMTVRRGEIIAENGVFTGGRGSGRFLRRKLTMNL